MKFHLLKTVLLLIGITASNSLFSQERLPNDTMLFNIAPNGMKIDVVFLSKTPCIDHSCFEFLVEYKDTEYSQKRVVGKIGLTLGALRFEGLDSHFDYIGVPAEALKLIADWTIANKEP